LTFRHGWHYQQHIDPLITRMPCQSWGVSRLTSRLRDRFMYSFAQCTIRRAICQSSAHVCGVRHLNVLEFVFATLARDKYGATYRFVASHLCIAIESDRRSRSCKESWHAACFCLATIPVTTVNTSAASQSPRLHRTIACSRCGVAGTYRSGLQGIGQRLLRFVFDAHPYHCEACMHRSMALREAQVALGLRLRR
jgi:hypothetical protein